jgi:hypothetical protein
MAKRRRTATRTQTKIVRMSSPAPIVRIAAPRAITRKRSRRRNGSGGHHVGGLVSNESIQMAIGGALYGFAVKSGLIAKLPAIPVLGRTGTAAILLDYFGRHGGGHLALRASRAAAAIAGYQLGSEGAIQGDADNADVHGDFTMGDYDTSEQ